MVCALDNIHIVLDNYDRMAVIYKCIEGCKQSLDIVKM